VGGWWCVYRWGGPLGRVVHLRSTIPEETQHRWGGGGVYTDGGGRSVVWTVTPRTPRGSIAKKRVVHLRSTTGMDGVCIPIRGTIRCLNSDTENAQRQHREGRRVAHLRNRVQKKIKKWWAAHLE